MKSAHVFVKKVDFSVIVTELKSFFGLSESEQMVDKEGIIRFSRFDIRFYVIPRHGYEDDFGIPFTEYSCAIGMGRISSFEGYTCYETMFIGIGNYMAEKIANSLGADTMFVDNLDTLISRFDSSKQESK